jgi:hypothetical protein
LIAVLRKHWIAGRFYRFLGIDFVGEWNWIGDFMSLNRYEQLLFDYIERNNDEKRFWEGRVLEIARQGLRRESLVMDLNSQLWDYFEERARFEACFIDLKFHEGDRKISMISLSEYLLKMWLPLPKKKPRR